MSVLAVVIPVFDERAGLPILHERLTGVLEALDLDWRIVYADDGSRDGSAEFIDALCDADARVAAVHLSRNFGQQIAIAAGLRVADADAVVLMDADLQDPPELIPAMLAEWRAGNDVVYAVKHNLRLGPLRRALVAGFYGLLRAMSNVPLPAGAGNFSLMDRAVVSCINAMPERNRFTSGLRAFAGGRQVGVEVVRDDRYDDAPRMHGTKLLGMAADAMFGFSELPLRVLGLFGLLTATVAAAALLLLLLLNGGDTAPPGWGMVVGVLALLAGVQLVALGILGEYLGRTYGESRGRPAYVVSRYRNLPPATRGTAPISLQEQRGRRPSDSRAGPDRE